MLLSMLLLRHTTHNADEDLQAITINDFTFITNRLHRPRMNTQVTPSRPNEAVYELKVVAYGREYRFETFEVQADGTLGASMGAAVTTDGASGAAGDNVEASTILTNLKSCSIN